MKLKPGEVICSKCHGKGKLGWVENIVGTKPPQLGRAFNEKARGKRFEVMIRSLAEILVERGFVSEQDLVDKIHKFSGSGEC